MKTVTTINEGNTNHLVIPAVFGIIAGGIVCIFNPIAGFSIIGMSSTLFATKTGIQIDIRNRQYKKYTDYFGFKLGKWKLLPEYRSVQLRLSVESHTYTSSGHANREITSKTITYDLIIQSMAGRKHIFHEFLKYKPALEMLNILAKDGDIETRDYIAERIQKNREKRNSF